jgi:hypothetical protein
LCPRTTIVATSCEILRIDGESVYRVPPLDVPAIGQAAPDYVLQYSAVELFVTRTKALNAGFAPHAPRPSQQVCGGIIRLPDQGSEEFAGCYTAARATKVAPRDPNRRFHYDCNATSYWETKL